MTSRIRAAPAVGERPVGQRPEDRRADAAAARLRRDDVAELELALGAVDVERERDADEPPVAVERGEALARAVRAARPRRA